MKRPSKTIKHHEKILGSILEFGHRTQDLRRAAILEAAVEIMATTGIDELTFERIGKQVKMARSHVVYYFSDRKLLVESALQFVALTAQEFIVQRLKDHDDWRTLLTTYVEANFQWIYENRAHGSVFLLMYYEATLKKSIRKLSTEARIGGVKRITGILQLSPIAWKESDLVATSKAIQGMITGNLIDVVTTDFSKEFQERKKQTVQSVLKLVDAFAI